MKRLSGRLAAIGAIVLLSLAFDSCALFISNAPRTGQVSKKDLPDPSENAIIFGTISDPNQTSMTAKWPIASHDIAFLQLNPASSPTYLETAKGMYATKSGVYYSKPVPAGGTYKLLCGLYIISGGQTTYYHTTYYGMMGKEPWDLKDVHPGLNYFGSWAYAAYEEGEKAKFIDFTAEVKLRKISSPNERECLEELLPHFKGTSWEPVITARIEELSK